MQDYAAIRRIQRRFVVMPVASLIAVVATVALLVIFGRVQSFILLPVALAVWVIYLRPVHRRRLRRALDNLPEWKITPE